MKLLLGLLLAGLGISTVHADAINLQTDAWCPYSCEPNSTNPGILVEAAQIIFKKAGHDVKYTAVNWARAVSNVREGKADGLYDAYKSDAPDFVFPDAPVISSQQCFFVKSNDSWRFTGYDSLKNRKISVANGYSYGLEFDAYIEKNNGKGDNTIQMMSGMDLMERRVQLAAKGRIDTIIEDILVFPHQAKSHQSLAEYQSIGGFKSVGCLSKEGLYIAFSPKKNTSKTYADLLSKGLRELKSSGELDKIIEKYR